MTIQQQIEQIQQNRRNQLLPKIEKRLSHIDKVEKQIESLNDLISIIHQQCETQHGPYYNILANDVNKEMEVRLNQVSTSEVLQLLNKTKKELHRLKKRFSRKSISLQVFGMAGSGKSTFIQSVTGLSNDVVLAAGGKHCTGASSFIYNSDHFETRVYFYTRYELLDIFNKSLAALAQPFGVECELQDFDAIETFNLSDHHIPEKVKGFMSVMKYVHNFALIKMLLSGLDANGQPLEGIQRDANGRQYIVITDPSKVQQWVAQHNGCDENDPNYRKYNNYLVVDHVDIYQTFNFEDAGNIVLMDNVGLGDLSSDISTQEHMYQAIADNSDAVILLYQPTASAKVRSEITEVSGWMDHLRYVDDFRQKERMDVNELFLVLNNIRLTGDDNTNSCQQAKNDLIGDEQFLRQETILTANAIDKQSVRDDAIVPILQQLADNLLSIDSRKMTYADELGQQLYIAFQELVRSVTKVISGSMRQGSNEMRMFKNLYKKLDYTNKLKSLDEQYAAKKEQICPEVCQSIESVVGSLIKLIDTPEVIQQDVERGEFTTNTIFEKYVRTFRNRIYEAFANINIDVLIPLQENVKKSLTNILFDNAKFGLIPLQNYAIEDGPSQQWLRTFIEEKVDRDAYPKMNEMLHFILDYQLNIQGLIEYNVAKSLNTIDQHNSEFKTMNPISGVSNQEHARKIWSEIVNRAVLIQAKMKVWRDEFSLIPSHSFYARVSMFRDMMVEDNEVREELDSFYAEYRMSIWRNEFAAMMQETEAFGRWNEECRLLTDLCVKNDFITK